MSCEQQESAGCPSPLLLPSRARAIVTYYNYYLLFFLLLCGINRGKTGGFPNITMGFLQKTMGFLQIILKRLFFERDLSTQMTRFQG